ncbi:hypothetical protein J2851_002002 [Azospirillum rugosum]|uniref:Uncharacterized protein n=1 Tax=Azospirillum rugosum TaxID=416170 RepID=A0ABS4SI27_9PROT|nr:hypothetical protein [Azospirillum rugosum]MDQ0525991.1 hypothetical protein [Azospirillum rugosum]
MQDTGLKRPFGDEFAATLLGHGDPPLFQCLLVDVGEVNVVEFHPSDFLELLLDTAACFEGVFKAATNGFLVVVAMGIEELQETRDRPQSTNGFRSDWGPDIHAGYRSVTGTARRQGQSAWTAIRDLVDGKFVVA